MFFVILASLIRDDLKQHSGPLVYPHLHGVELTEKGSVESCATCPLGVFSFNKKTPVPAEDPLLQVLFLTLAFSFLRFILTCFTKVRAAVLMQEDRKALSGETDEDREMSILYYNADDTIFEGGKLYEPSLYEIARGELALCANGKAIETFEPHTIFGELTFLIMEYSPALIKSTKKTDLRQYSRKYIADLSARHPGFGARFYLFLCYVLINRICFIFALKEMNKR